VTSMYSSSSTPIPAGKRPTKARCSESVMGPWTERTATSAVVGAGARSSTAAQPRQMGSATSASASGIMNSLAPTPPAAPGPPSPAAPPAPHSQRMLRAAPAAPRAAPPPKIQLTESAAASGSVSMRPSTQRSRTP